MKALQFILVSFFSLYGICLSASDKPTEEVFVNAAFRQASPLDTAFSLSIIDEYEVIAREATHLEDVLNLIPNVNFSSGASRGRFFQIRGIGERSQFVDPINPSVGLIIDGIDFTGVGGAATTLDIQQIEVLRGPQGTLYGANALAGLINIVSTDPRRTEAAIRLNLGNYNTRELTQVISGSIAEDVAMRVAFSKNQSAGYINNTYLDRDDTNNIDETTARTKLHWQANDDMEIKLTGYFVDADNGYDAFSLDNTRETLSDQPGHDLVKTRAAALQVAYQGFDGFAWETNLSGVNSGLEYGFDEDWSFRTICPIDSECAFFQFSTTDNYERNNQNISLDTRLVSKGAESKFAWVAGLYFRDQNVDLLRTYTNNDPNFDTFYGPIVDREITRFTSDYQTKNLAAYGQIDAPLENHFTISAGLRVENRQADYRDSNVASVDTDENLWGGKLAIEYRGFADHLLYALVSRGYKAGGNNVPETVDSDGNSLIGIVFDTEFMWNFEIGHKASWLDGAVQSQFGVFYQDREDIQIRQSLVTSRDTGEVNGDCPCDFTDFIDNAAAGANYGLELEIYADLNQTTRAWLSLGLLETEFRHFLSFSHVDADQETGEPFDLDGRAQAHAPPYQFAAGIEFDVLSNWIWRFDVEAKDAFFLSPRHNEKTESYTFLNTRLVYQNDNWSVALWGKNLSNEEVIVRGFGSFGNDPRKFYITEPYYQFGAPRTMGVSARLLFR